MMVHLFRSLIPLGLLAAVCSCKSPDFKIYSDPKYATQVEGRFAEKRSLASMRDSALFAVLDQKLTLPETQGLKFLYAYMPLNDLADYSGDFFLNQVRWSLAARDTFRWGRSIPEDVFRHFVLPYRINNENLDTARIVFFRELKDRIKNLSMLEAALEVNHWCHEKVTYRGSDIRTSAPLATLRTAYGRCGEESTFTVTALRSVAIPARQVYTPRWAHSDDNHAWVEFWADGKWYYLGACEPECVPNLGWFTEPARRAMLIHTKAFGNYAGTERVENQLPDYALLNTLSTYAPTKQIFVKVVNSEGYPVRQAIVEFTLYNYAEFYPISTKFTDSTGLCNFLTGFGDLLIWARSESRFGFRKISVGDVDTVQIIANQDPPDDLTLDLDMVPPIRREADSTTYACSDGNTVKLRAEDSIRASYEDTFRKEADARTYASSLLLDPDEVWNLLLKSRGNYLEIEAFINQTPTDLRQKAIALLKMISDKDLRDTKADILLDHLLNSPDLTDKPEEFNETRSSGFGTVDILNPRVGNEMLVGYRRFLHKGFGEQFILAVRKDPESLIRWIREEIRINENDNYYGTPLTPVGVFNLRIADPDSRKIFAVASFRTIGIPARLKQGTLDVEYWWNDQWNIVQFDSNSPGTEAGSSLVLENDPVNPVVPNYETHFTLARFESGKYNTLVYDPDQFGTFFQKPLNLSSGHYLLITGTRGTEGEVMTRMTFFELKNGEQKKVKVSLRESVQPRKVIGKVKPDWTVLPLEKQPFSWDQVLGTNKAVLCWIQPDKEPSKHIFQDLSLLKKEIDRSGFHFVFMIAEQDLSNTFAPDHWKNLPANSRFVVIPDLSSIQEVELAVGKSVTKSYPVVITVNKDGEITFLSTGYKIGIGEDLIRNSE